MAKEVQMEKAEETKEAPAQGNQLTPEQAVNIIAEALEKGNRAGAYSLKEANTILAVFEGIAAAILPKQEG